MVSRRLDAADRAALRPGCVYVWEERSPAADATGAGMERFTEGRHWHPSRVREVSIKPHCYLYSAACFTVLFAVAHSHRLVLI